MIFENTAIPKVVFTDFKLFNKAVPIDSLDSPLQNHISLTKEITLTHKQSIISFSFVAINYSSSEKNQYAYMLEGFEKDWNYIGNKKDAIYTNLDAGEYTLKVKASNNDGLWNKEGASLVNEKKIHSPKDVLTKMHKEIQKALKQDTSENDDGMDVCLCKIEIGKENKVIYSGAKRPLYIYKAATKEIEKIKGCLNSIGGNYHLEEFSFSDTEVIMEKDDMILLTSDGLVDQNNKKHQSFGTKKLLTTIIEIAPLPVEEQKAKLEASLNTFAEGVAQRDDITVIAIKF